MNILGIHSSFNTSNHDPSAAIVCDGELHAVCEEERFTRHKMGIGDLPIHSIAHCLKSAGLSIRDIDIVACDGQTWPELRQRTSNILKYYFGHVPRIEVVNHHTAHLASAYYCSGFGDAMCLSVDAYGDKVSTVLASGYGREIKVLEDRGVEQSLGLFYAIMTSYLGFLPGMDEYKVMGLAPYGRPVLDLSPIVKLAESDYTLNLDEYQSDLRHMVNGEPFFSENLEKLFGAARIPGTPLNDHYRNVACSVQDTLERALCALVNRLYTMTGQKKLCLAGGTALNCSANLKISQLPFIEDLFVQPAASDRGLCIGSALYLAVQNGEDIKPLDHAFKGPDTYTNQIQSTLELVNMRYRRSEHVASEVAQMLAQGKVIGYFNGKSEYGPRALGHRSILANPGHRDMKDIVNKKVKYREEFRPFAPAVLADRASDLFVMKGQSPYMTVAYPVRDEWAPRIPSVTHVNQTARVQTVSPSENPDFYHLIQAFNDVSGIPAVLNTSFNIKGQPIIETPLDAIGTYAATGLDVLVMGNCILEK